MGTLKKDDRQVWVDILKGIGIIAVVAGHIGGLLAPEFGLMRMPLFLFVAGFLFKVHADKREYLFKKFVHLLIPYICFLFLLYTPQAFMSVYHGHETILSAIKKAVLGGPLLEGRAGVFWFVTCLFATQQLMNFFLNQYSEKKVMIIMAVSLLLSFLSTELFPDFWLPWSLNGVLAAAPIFFAGYLFRKFPIDLKGFEFVLLIAVIFICRQYSNNLYNIKSNNFGIPVISFVSALVAISCLIAVARLLVGYKLPIVVFANISKGSMIIMYLHQSLQFYVKGLFANQYPYLVLIVVISICLGVYQLIKRSTYARALLLGSVTDFKKVFPNFAQAHKTEATASSINYTPAAEGSSSAN
jgi:fucose 4-O-acetylase-like acetyltransferase